MRYSALGNVYVESVDDNINDIFISYDVEPEDCHAVIREGEETEGKFYVEILRNDDGEDVVSTDEIFDTSEAAEEWAKKWVIDVQKA